MVLRLFKSAAALRAPSFLPQWCSCALVFSISPVLEVSCPAMFHRQIFISIQVDMYKLVDWVSGGTGHVEGVGARVTWRDSAHAQPEVNPERVDSATVDVRRDTLSIASATCRLSRCVTNITDILRQERSLKGQRRISRIIRRFVCLFITSRNFKKMLLLVGQLRLSLCLFICLSVCLSVCSRSTAGNSAAIFTKLYQ